MTSRVWLVCGGLLLAAAVRADAPPPPPADPPDPPGTSQTMEEMRALFAAWDRNGDNFLDGAELAKAFRGDDAKPYDPKAAAGPAGPNAAQDPDDPEFPDHDFLVRLDQDGDGRISRIEFMSWARDYAMQAQQQTEQDAKVAALEAREAAAAATELKALERQLKKEQAAAKKLRAQMTRETKAFERALHQHRRKHK